MNEKIKQLLAQAFLAADDQDQAYEKFAELIIKETLQVARDAIGWDGPSMEEVVCKHFGVEE